MVGRTKRFFTLNNGNSIPAITTVGVGNKWTKIYGIRDGAKNLMEYLKEILALPGFLHIMTAEFYPNNGLLSAALKASQKPRHEIWITDKYCSQCKLSSSPIEALERSLDRLGFDYVDLYLIHNPCLDSSPNGISLEKAWKQMELLYKTGKVKNIGVSNFRIEDLERLKDAEIKPQVNEIEFHAFLQNQTPNIYEYAKTHDLLLCGYSPLFPLETKTEDFMDFPFYRYIIGLAEKYNKTEAQILLHWMNCLGVLPVITNTKVKWYKEASDIISFELTSEELDMITELGKKHKPHRKHFVKEYMKYNSEAHIA
ncbi:aldo-keto reductase superfamily protein Ecym_3264 [Eremothecium cymbalariae DBVPG|uniref:NADP-dependent oxidoreductase domain-containing protein n=1 Tax=Eremothecium cymbalariae (strain CBS 270.75 / DBVPG 7215 / KCTC 17166 / NRRL Y-17582) TaxID=931890 RepID=G8JRI8_ERECY|nr:Hypothetical protein Ecym_3264 [Eremothecium cymbalariae DBVPG\